MGELDIAKYNMIEMLLSFIRAVYHTYMYILSCSLGGSACALLCTAVSSIKREEVGTDTTTNRWTTLITFTREETN